MTGEEKGLGDDVPWRTDALLSPLGGASMFDEVGLVLGVFEIGSYEDGEFGGDREIVGDGGAFSNVSWSLGVADASVISGTG